MVTGDWGHFDKLSASLETGDWGLGNQFDISQSTINYQLSTITFSPITSHLSPKIVNSFRAYLLDALKLKYIVNS
ncbi:hypothetical protein IQ227_07765 [Anabaena aphanizomenioides LEGE 00250]|jgi:hypothetical protein|uniref:Uncharacterized protein n=1 Tax=Sphaerospermopsis aphanizomenoides LEGE 00250 TaxID=2777972 RepID=A0ABR9VBQ1_9CYAN|nr:hypothetical protein [Sphaerospermopsis aphanizomenoides]MBE9235929.1 hypothetical protein [Sphaerospermopsis aphanizomenoides LEGE 00250]